MFIGLKKFLLLISLFMLAVACASGSQDADPIATDTASAEASGSQEVTTTTSAPAPEALLSAETLADGQPVAASFEGTGSADLGSLSVAVNYSLIIASDNGPLKVSI